MFGCIARWSFAFASACVGMACVGAPPPPPAGDGSGTTGDSGTTVSLPVTTTSAEDTRGTTDGAGTSSDGDTSTSTGTDETTIGVGPTTSSSEGGESSSESSSTGSSACESPCGSNQECTPEGMCVEACGGVWGTGSYDHCLTMYGGFDTNTVCGANHICVYWNEPITETACASQGCTTACDCPPPPATGEATVTCGEITNPVGVNECYLSCANGETCPIGMLCNLSGVCVNPVPELPVYGDCNNVDAVCAGDSFCANVPSGEGACFSSCNDAGDCPAGPASGTADVECGDAVGIAFGDECYLDCSGGATCPTGMSCFLGTTCLWNNL